MRLTLAPWAVSLAEPTMSWHDVRWGEPVAHLRETVRNVRASGTTSGRSRRCRQVPVYLASTGTTTSPPLTAA